MTFHFAVVALGMEIKKLGICSVSAKKEGESTLFGQCVQKLTEEIDTFLFLVKENKESLSKIYNLAIEKALKNDCDALMLVHDDVILEENPIPKLEKLFDEFDLVGVAGTSKIELKSPALWHLMGGGFYNGYEPSNLHGRVQHLQKVEPSIGMCYTEKIETNFGYYPHRVVMIDGVFMAMNRKVMEKMRFDEENPCKFHFYDLSFSLDCHLNGFKVGVGDILITHASPGLREFTEDWKNGEKWFLNKYEK